MVLLPLLAASALAAPPKPAPHTVPVVFATAAVTPYQERAAALLVESIRTYGGEFSQAPIYIAVDNPDTRPCTRSRERGARIIPLEAREAARAYPFAAKVYAAAQVERIVARVARTLVWLDPETLVLAPPTELDLDGPEAVAPRPVFLLNTVGLPADQPVDQFWSAIYDAAGADPATVPTVESLVEGIAIRFYINCGIIAYRPGRGICRAWAGAFGALVSDEAFQRSACADARHRIFLHQAVLSAVVAARTRPHERRWLPPTYVYPLHLHDRLPIERRAHRLNDLACTIVESLWEEAPGVGRVMPVDEPLRSWLVGRQKDLR